MSAVCRPARLQDLEHADALVVRSINDLTERHGFGPMAVLRPPRFQLFSLKDDPDGLWVAEDSGQILGFAFSWVCGDLWFLAQLFVAPGQQGGGIGNELLERTLDHAQKTGATKKALITFAFNRVSQGLYIRHGLFPRLPLFFFSVPREALRGRLQGAQFCCAPLENSASHLHSLAQFDAPDWPERRFGPALATIVLGVAYTGFSEWLNVSVRRSWAYSDWMLVLRVGSVQIGLSPLAQWMVVPAAAFSLIQRRTSH